MKHNHPIFPHYHANYCALDFDGLFHGLLLCHIFVPGFKWIVFELYLVHPGNVLIFVMRNNLCPSYLLSLEYLPPHTVLPQFSLYNLVVLYRVIHCSFFVSFDSWGWSPSFDDDIQSSFSDKRFQFLWTS